MKKLYYEGNCKTKFDYKLSNTYSSCIIAVTIMCMLISKELLETTLQVIHAQI